MKPTKDQFEVFEKARKRAKQKKRLISHFVLFLIGSTFFVILNKVMKFHVELDWYVWGIFIWLFFLCIHIFNVFVTKRFFGKEWERVETEKLIEKHQKMKEELETKLEKKGVFNDDNNDDDTSITT